MRHPERAIVLVTHYQRLLDYVEPDRVHVLIGGSIVRSGTKELALELEQRGYSWLEQTCGGGNMSALLAEQNIYATQFSEIVDRLPGRGLDWLDRLRKNGIERFVQLGFPTTRLEDWKYTNVAADWPAHVPASANPFAGRRFLIHCVPSLIFFPAHGLSLSMGSSTGLCPSIRTASWLAVEQHSPNRSAIRSGRQHWKRHLGRYADMSDHAFVAWNTAFFADGAYVVIPAGDDCHTSDSSCFCFHRRRCSRLRLIRET